MGIHSIKWVRALDALYTLVLLLLLLLLLRGTNVYPHTCCCYCCCCCVAPMCIHVQMYAINQCAINTHTFTVTQAYPFVVRKVLRSDSSRSARLLQVRTMKEGVTCTCCCTTLHEHTADCTR